MKKVLLLLVLSVFFIHCSTNDDLEGEEQEENQENPENLAISIAIEGTLLHENREKILYISNEEGVIQGQISLRNYEENLLSIEREPNAIYHAIIHDKAVYNSVTRHEFYIFENMESSDYTMKATSNGAIGALPNVDLSIDYTGNLKPMGMTGGGTTTTSGTDGGTLEAQGTCMSKPGDFYSLFKKEDENFARYFWTENVDFDKSFTLDYEELPIASLVETQLPEHVSTTVFVDGFSSEHPSAGHPVSRGNTQGDYAYESYVPEEAVFDYFSFTANLFDGTSAYSFFSVSETVPSSIQIPSFDFTINNFSIDDTNYTTTGDYDMSTANFTISDGDLQVLVKVISERDSRVSFSIGTLINSLFEEWPSLDAAQLEPYVITLSSNNHQENYEEVVQGFIEDRSFLPGNYNETVSRFNN